MTIAADIQSLTPGSLVELFVLDLTSVGGSVLRFHAGVNNLLANVVWQGVMYTAMPMEVDGFAMTSKGTLPRPKIRVSNYAGLIGTYCKTYNDMIGAKVTRKRTLTKYLDAVNFTGGVNATADPNMHLLDDIFFIDRKSAENRLIVEFELAAAFDVQGVSLPRRQFIQNVCAWRYRSAECGFSGGAIAAADDSVTTVLEHDVCGKRLTSCKLRFGQYDPLPFGAFPSAGLVR